MAGDRHLVEFEESLSRFRDYPLNLTRTVDFPYTLTAYNTKLVKDEKLYFDDSQPRIRIWDLVDPRDGKQASTSIANLLQLRNALSKPPTDPCRRFIFIKSGSSRSPLDCTREMMAYLFTHHQIMARFLDFTCAFKEREIPHSLTYFRNEDYLSSQHYQPGLSAIGRSGIRIQHCFNVLGIERSRDKKQWLLRQTAAYHSYDLVQGRALWVVLKGDNTMRKRLESETEESVEEGDGSLHSIHGSFARTLTDHLLVTQWAVENWESYAESLELECRSIAVEVDHAPVDEMADDIAIIKQHEKMAIPPHSPPGQKTTHPTKSTELPDIIRKLTRGATTDFSKVPQVELPPRRIEHHRIDELVQFDKLQSLSRIGKSLGEATSAIAQNRRVLAQIKEYYRELVHSQGFKRHVATSSLETCTQTAAEFVTKIGRLEDDLANYEGNLRTILHGVERTETMYNAILQYQGMRTAKYFTESTERSTEVMERWTRETHEKTVSMHAITVVTLVFLPATFVASFFSSGILRFGEDVGGGSGSAMDAWKVRGGVLKLFAVVCFPLLTLTLVAWCCAYGFARLKRKPRKRIEHMV